LDKWTKLTSIYNSSSTIFIELFKTFTTEKLDEETQLKIETFLMNQAQILIDPNLESKGLKKIKGEPVTFINRKVDS
jgi:hypothetical protein